MAANEWNDTTLYCAFFTFFFAKFFWPFWWFHSSEKPKWVQGYMIGTYKYTGIFGYLLMRFISDIPQIGSFAHCILLQEKNTSVSMQYLQCHFHSFIFDITLHLRTRSLGAKLLGIYNWNYFHCNTPTFRNLIKLMPWLLH